MTLIPRNAGQDPERIPTMGDVLQVDFKKSREKLVVPDYNPAGYTEDDDAFVSAELASRGLPMGAGGHILEHPVTTGAEIAAAVPGCAFEVVKTPLYAQHGEGPDDRTAIDSHVALLRSDTMAKVGIVGKRYGVVQPMSMWNIFDGMDVEWEQVGSLRGGAVLYAVAKVARYDVVKGDTVEQLMLLWQALDGSGSVRVLLLQKRIVCMNVIGGLVKGGQGVSIRHTRFAEQRLGFAAKALRKAQEDAVASQRLFADMASTRFSGRQFAELCMKLVPDAEIDPKTGAFLTNNTQRENTRATLQAHYAGGIGQDHPGVAGTAWAALNAITQFTTHDRSAKGGQEVRAESNLMGSGHRFAARGFELIQSMVG